MLYNQKSIVTHFGIKTLNLNLIKYISKDSLCITQKILKNNTIMKLIIPIILIYRLYQIIVSKSFLIDPFLTSLGYMFISDSLSSLTYRPKPS